ncbi:putative membrane protein YngC [Robertmurraya siralis]|uniref:Membrane protein YngC n=1 Tax=Robertmurraya siralis TaxID=77777 RepID=A0A919WFM1_9BACI|nr:DedA family protein [Robertmurraya siralis]PAE22379.1 DedA family protein [Bacillus sp. 7504-2]GIN60908.1 putative membrane protein YngC [Robertmurraya siralis]
MHEIISNIFEFLSALGYFGILFGLMIEIIPSEIVLSYGGYLIGTGQIHFFGALLCGVIGGTLAQLFLYWLGAYGGRPFLEKYGKYILIQKKHLDAAESWFHKYGTGVIFSARFIPVIRHAISIPAGIARVPLAHFTLLTIGAMIPWTILFLLLGIELGEHWQKIEQYSRPLILPIIGLSIAGVILYFMFTFLKEKGKKS